MVKPHGPICNLDCTYCYYLSKKDLYPSSNFVMSTELLEEFTRQYIKSQARLAEISFNWQGGEPLLAGLGFYQKAIEYQRQYARPGQHITNALQTNGTLLDDEWCQFFKLNDFLIGISLDGPADLHDVYRRDKGGRPTFNKVMEGIKLLKKHHVEFNTLATVNSVNVMHPLELYRFLRDEVGAQFIQFIPIVEQNQATKYSPDERVSACSVTAQEYGDFLIKIFDEWVRRDVGKVFVQLFDVALAAWIGKPTGLCIFDRVCGNGLALEHNGDLYSCDHFVEPRYKLGNILTTPMADLATSYRQQQFGWLKRTALPQACLECPVRFACNGGCPKDRFAWAPGGEPGLNYLCAGYKAFFEHINPPMTMMKMELQAGQPPANVTKRLKREGWH